MANRKISDLTALTAPATGDLLPIVDISEAAAADKNKKITYGELLASAPDGSAAAPSFSFDSDPNTGIYSPGADQVAISTGGSGRLFVDASGNVGVGTSAPDVLLHSRITGGGGVPATSGTSQPNAAIRIGGSGTTGVLDLGCNSSAPWIQATDRTDLSQKYQLLLNPNGGNVGIGTTSPAQALSVVGNIVADGSAASQYVASSKAGVTSTYLMTDANGGNIQTDGAWPIRFTINSSERVRIDSSGRLLVGTSSARSNFFNTSTVAPALQIEGITDSTAALSLVHSSSSTIGGPLLILGKQKSGGVGGNTIVTDGNQLGVISFQGCDGSELVAGASIEAWTDSTTGANDMPGRLVFFTTADGAASPTERMRITSAGRFNNVSTEAGIFSETTQAAGTSFVVFQGRYSATAGSPLSGTTSFQVYSNGNVENANNSYGAISDIKLKENIVDANSQWDDLKALQVRNYNFKEGQTHTQIGLVAQEVELVSPGLVTESPDRDEEGNDLGTVTKSVNYSVLYMKAVKALQEAMDRIETLEARLTAAGI